MVTTQPPPYSGEKAPPPAYTGTQAATAPPATAPPPTGKPQAGGNKAVYWSYWGILFASLLTWIFSVAAAAGDSWLSYPDGSESTSLENECYLSQNSEELDEACNLFNAARVFKFLATTVISITLVLIVIAAFMAAPITGKLGLAAGITLVVFSLFELLAFALMAAFMEKLNSWGGSGYYNSIYSYSVVYYDVEPGPSFAVAVVAWIFGTVGAITTLVLRARATTDQDGPFRKCMPNTTGANTGTPAMAPPPAVGTV